MAEKNKAFDKWVSMAVEHIKCEPSNKPYFPTVYLKFDKDPGLKPGAEIEVKFKAKVQEVSERDNKYGCTLELKKVML